MLTPDQKFELAVARRLVLAGLLPAGAELVPGSNPPDVVAKLESGAVGVEVRRLYLDEWSKRGSPSRQGYEHQREVVETAQEIHQKFESRAVFVHVHFCRRNPVQKRRIPELAQLLVGAVRNIEELGPQVTEVPRAILRSKDPVDEIDRVTVSVVDIEHEPFWGLADSDWVSRTTHEFVQGGLDKKEATLPRFDGEFEEKWVALVCDGSVGASLLEPHAGIEDEVFRSSFGRAFLLTQGLPEIVELTLGNRMGPSV